MKHKKYPTKKQRIAFLVLLAVSTFILEYYRPQKESWLTSLLFFFLFIYELKNYSNEGNL